MVIFVVDVVSSVVVVIVFKDIFIFLDCRMMLSCVFFIYDYECVFMILI